MSEGLADEFDALRRRVDELTIDGSAAQDFDENFADSARVAAELGENLTLAAALREQLADVEGALARLENGTYGRCQECGDVIGADRLEAMPATPFCITHA